MSLHHRPVYSIAAIERLLNAVIHFVFYYRLVLVVLALSLVVLTAARVGREAAAGDRYKTVSVVFGLGSVIIGIFYSILNYENNHLRYRAEEKKSKYVLCFQTVRDWHQPTMVINLKITKQLYDEHQHLITDNRAREFFDILEANEEGRAALVSVLNYFEGIAIGIRRSLLDDDYMRSAFAGIANTYLQHFGVYIQYRRAHHRSPAMWINFTTMVEGWNTARQANYIID